MSLSTKQHLTPPRPSPFPPCVEPICRMLACSTIRCAMLALCVNTRIWFLNLISSFGTTVNNFQLYPGINHTCIPYLHAIWAHFAYQRIFFYKVKVKSALSAIATNTRSLLNNTPHNDLWGGPTYLSQIIP